MRRPYALVPPLLAGILLATEFAPAADTTPPKPVVLHVGDSFLASGFAQALRPKFEAAGAKYVSASQTSAYTTTLHRQVKLDLLITVNKPALIIVTIGANEMRMPSPEQHAHAVKNLAKLVSAAKSEGGPPTPCIFALPPRWDDGETGILAIEKRDSAPCRVFDPAPIEKSIPRGPDKIHPSAKGGAIWADAFWTWLMDGRKEGEKPWDPPPSPSAAQTEVSR